LYWTSREPDPVRAGRPKAERQTRTRLHPEGCLVKSWPPGRLNFPGGSARFPRHVEHCGPDVVDLRRMSALAGSGRGPRVAAGRVKVWFG
jgi:hypothetical protein